MYFYLIIDFQYSPHHCCPVSCRGVQIQDIFVWVNSANHPSAVPLEQAKPDLKVAFEESRITKIDRFLPVGSMNVHSTFHAKPAIGFWNALRSQTSKQTSVQRKAII